MTDRTVSCSGHLARVRPVRKHSREEYSAELWAVSQSSVLSPRSLVAGRQSSVGSPQSPVLSRQSSVASPHARRRALGVHPQLSVATRRLRWSFSLFPFPLSLVPCLLSLVPFLVSRSPSSLRPWISRCRAV